QGYRFVVPVRVVEPANEQVSEGIGARTETAETHITADTHAPADTGPEEATGPARPTLHVSLSPPIVAQPAPVAGASARRRAWPYGLLALALLLVVGLTAVVWRWRAGGQRPAPAVIKSIAVLPFKPLGAESNDE